MISASPKNTNGPATVQFANQPICPPLGNKIDGFVAINRYIPIFQGPLDTPYLHRFFDDAKARLAEVDLSGPLPDRYVQSNYEAMNALKVAFEIRRPR
jgi:hypothetical protein